MKRAFSDSEGDDGFGEEECGSVRGAGSPTQSCHSGGGSTRKKRRGVIEKRRRDRINQSLGELRRLVPAAFEKQGSAKLEKAEILQMTVDHLKILSSKGLNNYNVDTAALALDYRSIGFRECMSEVARYLVSVEGLDIQDPLRLRLGSHLQCYCAQREVASKAAASLQHSHTAAAAGSWNLPPNPAASFNTQYNTAPAGYNSLPPPPPPSSGMISQSTHPVASSTDHLSMSAPQSVKLPAYSSDSVARLPQGLGGSQVSSLAPLPASGSTAPHGLATSSSSAPGSSTQAASLSGLSQMASQFPGSGLSSASCMPLLSPHYSSSSSTASAASAFQQSSVRHHRPWGTDLAF